MTSEYQTIPSGFERHFRQSPVTDPWEPLYMRRDAPAFSIGLWIDRAHCNGRELLHGGVVSALADNAMGLCCVMAMGEISALTANLGIDFLAVGKIGKWLEVRASPAKLGRTLAFAEARICADEELIARSRATFRILAR